MLKLFIMYLLLMNALGLLLMIVDKSRARKRLRRISEANLFTVAALGGSPAVLFSMLVIRHKTKHKKFTVGIPLILSTQVLLLIYLIIK